jgi:hypothetical protein
MKACKLIVILFLLLVLSGCQYTFQNNNSSPTTTAAMTQTINSTTSSEIIDTSQATTQATTQQYRYSFTESKYAPGFFKANLSDLEEITDAVVVATMINTRSNPDLDKTAAIMLTTIRIDKVLKGDGKVLTGREYILIEYYRQWIDPENPSIINVLAHNIMPLRQNQQYLLFLRVPSQKYGDYATAGGYQGKFPITELTVSHHFRNLTSEDMEFPSIVAPSENRDPIWGIAAQAFARYLAEDDN